MSTKPDEENVQVVYSTPTAVMFSDLAERQMGLKLSWRKWKHRWVELRSNGTIIVRKDNKNRDIFGTFNASTVDVTNLEFTGVQDSNVSTNPIAALREVGIMIKLKDTTDHETQIRFVTNDAEKEKFYGVLKSVAKSHNLDNVRRASLTGHMSTKKKIVQTSAMRSAVANAMDSYDNASRKDHIVAKRGAFKWLPVLFANDLVHGSWYV